MRISSNMINDRVVFNMQRSISRFMELQTSMSSGRRINKPSDDPVGIQRDLIYRSELSKNAQYRKNINQAQTWVQSYDYLLADVKDIVSSSKEIAVAMANDTYDEVTRNGAANEVAGLISRLLQLGNDQLEGKHIFSGFRTNEPALSASDTGVVYKGDFGQMKYQIDASSDMTVNMNGADVFLKPVTIIGENADLNLGVKGTTLLADLNNGNGIDMTAGSFTITDQNKGIVSTIDLSTAGATTVQDTLDAINAQLAIDGITDLQAVLGSEGNNILLDVTPSGTITANTPVSALNSGNGLDLTPGQFLVSDNAGINVIVDISSATNVGDVISQFNNQMAVAGYPTITMQLNPTGTGFQIDDSTSTLNVSVSDLSAGSTTAQDLGLVGAVSPSLVGTDLNPKLNFEINETTGTTAADLGLSGLFHGDYSGSDVDPILKLTSNIADLNNGRGYPMDRIVIHQGERSRVIDLSNAAIVTIQDMVNAFDAISLDITASINADGRGIQIVNNDPNTSLFIEDENNNNAAKQLGIWGASDTMGSVMLLERALRNNDQDGIGRLLENLDQSMQHLLNMRASVGAKGIRLESTQNRLQDLEMSFTKRLSEVEDADLTELVTQLATHEANYKASLMASASIIQPSLLDFLR